MSLRDIFINGRRGVYRGLNTYFGTSIPGGETLDEIINEKSFLEEAIKNTGLLSLLVDYREDKLQYSQSFVEAISEDAVALDALEKHGTFFGNIIKKYPYGKEKLFNSIKFAEKLVESKLFNQLYAPDDLNDFYAIKANRDLVRKNYMEVVKVGTHPCITAKTLAVLMDLDFTDYINITDNTYEIFKRIHSNPKALEFALNSTYMSGGDRGLGHIVSGLANNIEPNFPKEQYIHDICGAAPQSPHNLNKLIKLSDMNILNMLFHPRFMLDFADNCAVYDYSQSSTGYYGVNIPSILSKKLMKGRRIPLIGRVESSSQTYTPSDREFIKFTTSGFSKLINGSYGGLFWQNNTSTSACSSITYTDKLDLTNISKVFFKFRIDSLNYNPELYFGISSETPQANWTSRNYYNLAEYIMLDGSNPETDNGSYVYFEHDVSHLKGSFHISFLVYNASGESNYFYLCPKELYLEY